ncbi:hypothetical protein THOM_2487, partial [Trachipleistophora hominis]
VALEGNVVGIISDVSNSFKKIQECLAKLNIKYLNANLICDNT